MVARHSTIRGLSLWMIGLAVPWGCFLGFSRVLGLWPHPEVGTWHLLLGVVLCYLATIATGVLGLTWMADLLKLVLAAAAFGLLWGFMGPAPRCILLGLPVGTAMPLLARVIYAIERLARAQPSDEHGAEPLR